MSAYPGGTGLVLVATPARTGTPARILAQAAQVYRNLGYSPRERAVYLNEQPDYVEKFMPNAAARNQLIERYLRPEHDWVLWLDADIIETPPDLIERLMDVSTRHGLGIAAPMIWMERVRPGPVGFDNGGWFYDTGGFVDEAGLYADFYAGVMGDEPEVGMMSVGCVYLVPAWLYREGLRYHPTGDQVEHMSFCLSARDKGLEVVATRDVNVTHAYLPEWGETWGHRPIDKVGL